MTLPLPKPLLARGQEVVASNLEKEEQVLVEGQQEYCSHLCWNRDFLVQQHVVPWL